MARIIISGEDEKKIWFTEECTGCHLCTKYCVYGAIVLKEKEE
jgi:Fe-S-cluster-containing hydrogenase component 2